MDATINIYSADGTILKTVPVTSAAEHVEEMMKSNYVRLQWSDVTGAALPVGAYIIYGNKHYTLFEAYQPTQKDELEYNYEPQFQHPMMILAYTPCLYTTYKPGEHPNDPPIPVKQTDWEYVGTLGTICEKLQAIIAEELGTALTIEITVKTTTNVPASAQCSFSGADILTAIGEVCTQFGDLEYCIDWDNAMIYIGDIALGESAIELTEGENVTFASVSTSGAQSSEVGNYYIVRGGTRNITIQTASGNNVQTSERLELDPVQYPDSAIDTRTPGNNEPKLQRILIFDDVYPKLDLYVYNVRKRIRRLLRDGDPVVKEYNQDGTVRSYRTYAVYYLRLAYFTDAQFSDWEDFEVDPTKDIVNGKNLMASFEPNETEGATHSELAGREFEMIAHTAPLHIEPNSDDKGIIDSGIDILKGDYEIVFQQDDELIIPNEDTLEPWGEDDAPTNLCDIVVLFNIVMSPEYLSTARTTLAEKAEKEIIRRSINYNTYQVNSIAAAFHESNPGLTIGCKVNFNKANGQTIESRVTALTTKLDYEEVQTISISNAIIKGATQALKEEVKAISTAIEINETSATSLNRMIASLMRALREYENTFIHKDRSDETGFDLGIGGNLDVEQTASVLGNLTVGAEDTANNIYPALKVFANLLKTELGGALQTYNYFKDMSYGTGWGVDFDGNMQVGSLEVRSALRVLELVYNRLSAEESEYVFTEAGTITEVQTDYEHAGQFVCTLDKRNETDFHAFHCGDVLRGIVNDLTELGGGTYYTCWLEVVDTDTSVPDGSTERNNTITVRMYAGSDCPSGTNYPPMKHMVVQRWGNSVIPSATTHADERYSAFIEQKDGKWVNRRQSCWYISSIEKRIMFLDHVFQPKINEGNYAAFFGLPVNISSFKGHNLDPTQPYLYCRGVFLQDIHFINYLGTEYKVERDRGAWSAETAASQDDPYIVDYAVYQTVTHNNCKWECVSEVPAVYEPSKDNTSEWKLLKENIVPSVYTLITNVKTVIRDSEGTPNVDVVKCYVRKTMDEATTNDTQNQLGYLYYSINGENLRRGNQVELAADDGIKSIRFVFYPRKTEELGSAVMGQSKFGMAMVEAVVDVLDEARGEKGDRGVTLRGPSKWEIGKEYQGGNEGDEYQDIVILDEYPHQMYLCKLTHTASQDTYPPTHSLNDDWTPQYPWTQTEYREFTATKVLFADRGKIENADIKEVTIRGTITEDSKVHNKVYDAGVTTPPSYEEQGYVVNGVPYDPTDPANLVEIVGSDVEGKEGSLYSVSCELAVLEGHEEIDWEHDVKRIDNQIIQLPTYKKTFIYKKVTGEIWFHSNPYKVAGTKLSVFTTQDIQHNWWGFNFDQHETDYVNLLNEGVLVCADPESLLGHILKSGTDLNVRPYHLWNLMSYNDASQAEYSDGLHGRFSFNGRIARFVLLLPGQHLDLISKIEYVPKYDSEYGDYVAEPALVWDICNASDFDAIDINVYATNNPTEAAGTGETISDFDSSYYADASIYGGGGQGCNEAFVCKQLKMTNNIPVKLEINLAGRFANGNLNAEEDVPSWEIKLNPSNNN